MNTAFVLTANLTWYLTDHCVEMIRMRLACTSDIGLIPFVWLGHNGRLFADTGREHTCHNYDRLLDWARDNLQGFPEGPTVKPKPGDFVVDDFI